MQIISTNIGKPVTVEWHGQQVETGIYKYAVDTPICLGYEDVVNDHVLNRQYHGGVDKACYLYSSDHYPFWKNKYPDLVWQLGMFGENLTVQGLDESEIRIGDIYQIGGAVVQVSQPRQPCFKLGIRFGNQSVVEDFWESSYPGVYVRVIKAGNIVTGDVMILISRNMQSLSVSQVFSIFSSGRDDLEFINRAIQDPHLAESCRRDIQKISESKRSDV